MTLEQQVTSLEIAKRLKELGVKQESLFVWMQPYEDRDWEIYYDYKSSSDIYYSAFTVAELGEMLPDYILRGKGENNSFFQFDFDKGGRKYDVRYAHWIEDNQLETDFEVRGSTEADARGKMLIYLLENKLITI